MLTFTRHMMIFTPFSSSNSCNLTGVALTLDLHGSLSAPFELDQREVEKTHASSCGLPCSAMGSGTSRGGLALTEEARGVRGADRVPPSA